MVELFGEPIETDRAKKLREWLGKPEGQIFRSVIAAKMRLMMENAVATAMKSDGNDGYAPMSSALVAKARRYQCALEVIEEIANPETELHNIRLKI